MNNLKNCTHKVQFLYGIIELFMETHKTYFKNKKVTVLGLGLLGKRLGDVQFLSKHGAHVLVTDLKNKKDLASSIKKLKGYKNITYRFGEHKKEDFENIDFVLKGQGTPLDSPYIHHARKNNIPIEMDESLFLKLAPKNIKVIAVTGTRGKTTTTMCIYHSLKKAGVSVHLGGNIRDTALLSLLPKVKSGDTVVLELSSWQLQALQEIHYSPEYAVFTNFMPDHMNYYNNDLKLYFEDKAQIFKYQNKKDVLVVGEDLVVKIKKYGHNGKLKVARKGSVPKDWNIKIPGEHNRKNIACVIEVLKVYGLTISQIKKGVESFKGVDGRLKYIRTYKGVDIYNDTTSTTPEALSAALSSFEGKHVVLLSGGTTKNLDVRIVIPKIKKHTDELVLLPGTGTDTLLKFLTNKNFYLVKTLKEGVKKSLDLCTKGSILLFSPGFASFGLFKNEYDRGDQFDEIIKKLN